MINFRSLFRFFSFEAINIRVVLLTAAISYILQISAIISSEPLYMIAFMTLLPWIPLVLFEGVWKVKNYAAVAFLGVFTILQIGHFAEHLIQVIQIEFFNGIVVCPPPVDSIDNALRAVENGLRDAAAQASFYSVERIIKPGADGFPALGPDGEPLLGVAACAVFGQLDIELVHLIWELVGWTGTGICLFFFRRNVFLWIAFAALCWHALEHLTITYFYYFDQAKVWEGFKQVWATYPLEGKTYVAEPVGKEAAMLNFYEAGGKFGLMARHGLFEQLTGVDFMPPRPHLHMGYNLVITVPTVLGFLLESRRIANRYLGTVFEGLSEAELTHLTNQTRYKRYSEGARIFSQGDRIDAAYVVSSGKVEIVSEREDGTEVSLAVLEPGQLFGEMGFIDLKQHRRMAHAIARGRRVECIQLDAQTLEDMIKNPEGGAGFETVRAALERLAKRRSQENQNALEEA
jgi:CRP-like cAMP-binding protein